MMRLYRILLRLFPRAFREAWGEEMEADLRARLTETRGPIHRARVLGRAAWDALTHAASERRRSPTVPRAPGARGRRRRPSVDPLLQDLRYALRSLAGSPGFVLVVVATLALGVGANAGVFSVVNAVLLRPLPYGDADRLVTVWPEENFNKAMVGVVEKGVPALEAVSGFSGWSFTLTGEGEPAEVSGALVSAKHFQLLGVPPLLGRTFRAEEELPGAAGVVILSHGLWTRRFGGDPAIVGRTLRIGGAEYEARTVVGVMPPDHQPVIQQGEPTELWVPLETDPTLPPARDDSWFVNHRIGRLAEGATVALAQQQLRSVAARLQAEIPRHFGEASVRAATVQPLRAHQVAEVEGPLWILLGVVALVLFIACVNVANLLLARGEARERELSVRAALGAGRGRIVRQLLTESLVLGAGGGSLGVAVALWGTPLLSAHAPATLPRAGGVEVDGAVLLFALATSLAATLLFGLAPALHAARPAATAELGGSSRGGGGSGRQGVRFWLVAGEVALAVVIVVASGLMLRTLERLYDVDPGFDPEHVLVFRVAPSSTGYPSSEDFVHYYDRLFERLGTLPGVEAAGGIQLLPATSNNWSFPAAIEGHDVPEGEPVPTVNFRIVTPSYFQTLRIPLRRGRRLTRADGVGEEPARALVNESFVHRYWPDGDPLGRTVRIFGRDLTVVGVVGDVRQFALDVDPLPEIYLTHVEWPWQVSMWVALRTDGPPLAVAPTARAAVWSLDPDVPVSDVDALERVVARTAGDRRFVAALLGLFGVLALSLGAVGVYGVTSYVVVRRVREFGIRMALGAPARRVLGLAVRQGMRPVLVGIGVGLVAAAAAAGMLSSVLFGVGPRDPVTFVGVAAFLTVVAVAATALPAWRASRVDPARVLRGE